MDTGFVIILVAALVLSVGLSLLQHTTYNRAVKRMTRAFAGEKDYFLVSGRGKGRLRGAVVLLVIDSSASRIVAAEAMIGSTVLARFRGRPDLLGPLSSAIDRVEDRWLKEAVAYAQEQYKVTLRASKSAAARR